MIKTNNFLRSHGLFYSVLFALLFTSILFYSCKKDIISSNNPTSTYTGDFALSEEVNASIGGTVLLENGNFASNALISIGGQSVRTDAEGKFVLESIQAPKDHAHLTVTLDGYFTGHRTLRISEGARSFTIIRLLKKELTQSFNSTEGATIRVKGDAKIIFKANSLVYKKSGAPYTGKVNVYSKWIDPAGENLSEFTPGCLRGINLDNGEENLETFGMFAVDLYDDNMQELQIKSDVKAELHFPIPEAMRSFAPNEMPSWSLNEQIGMWQEEGTLRKVGNAYVGLVEHFSFWNCDLPGVINIQMELRDSTTNAPLSNYKVTLTRLNSTSTTNLVRHGYSNSHGIITGGAPPNENVQLDVILYCGYQNQQILKTMNFVTGSTGINLGVILVNSLNNASSTITGKVLDQNNTPIPNAEVSVMNTSQNGLPNVINADANGNFVYTTPNCAGTLNLEIIGYDKANKTNSGKNNYNIQIGNTNIGNLNASTHESEYMQYTCVTNNATNTYLLIEPMAQFNCFANNSNLVYVTSFSRIPGQDWYSNFRISGSLAAVGQHKLQLYRDKFDGLNTFTWNLDPSSPIYITKAAANTGDLVEGSISTNYLSPHTNDTRQVQFRIRRDF